MNNKRYRIFLSTSLIIEAENEEEARQKFIDTLIIDAEELEVDKII